MLIISGGDFTGKTTTIDAIYQRIDRELHWSHMPQHLTRPPSNFDYYCDYIRLINPYSIWDRFALDSIAYRMLDEHPSSLTPMKWSLVEAACRLKGAFQVILYCNYSASIEARAAERAGKQHDMYDIDHAKRVNQIYADMSKRHSIVMRGHTYRYTLDMSIPTDVHSQDEVVEIIFQAYAEHFVSWKKTQTS